jgi:3,4-dihydroxy 2-butanone 4-phosphate synthase/GTP cyclohydrolase II
MARYGRGLICLTLTGERCQQLRLPLMVTDNNAAYATNFTVSIEAILYNFLSCIHSLDKSTFF